MKLGQSQYWGYEYLNGYYNVGTQVNKKWRDAEEGKPGIGIKIDQPTGENISDALPIDLEEIGELCYYSKTPAMELEPFDLYERKTEIVVCSYDPINPSADTVLVGDALPFKLDQPSPWLRQIRLGNLPVTQTLVDNIAACPNLENVVIGNINAEQIPTPDVGVRTIPAPANSGNIKTWAFKLPGVQKIEDWKSKQLKLLIVCDAEIEFLPSHLLRGESLLVISAGNNQIDTQGAEGILADITDNLILLELYDNQIADLPFLPDGSDLEVCYHNTAAEFRKDSCCCDRNSPNFMRRRFLQTLRSNCMSDYGNDIQTEEELQVRRWSWDEMKQNRLIMNLDNNPFHNLSFPKINGNGKWPPSPYSSDDIICQQISRVP